MQLKSFVFNPFQENTYILYNDARQAIIIDPGMYFPDEFDQFYSFIADKNLTPTLLLNTHTHLDHLFGNASVLNRFSIPFAFHKLDRPIFDASESAGKMYGLTFEKSPEPTYYLDISQRIELGEEKLSMMLTPGHSPGSVCFYNEQQQFVISGDVLFQNSIGRSDFPGGNYETLIHSIQHELMTLPDEVVVYSGHGPTTSIGVERRTNPFLQLGEG